MGTLVMNAVTAALRAAGHVFVRKADGANAHLDLVVALCV
jgi:hypothetical protein